MTLIFAISAPTYADAVYLKNGDRISGHVLSANNPEILNFRTSFNQDIQLPRITIKAINYNNNNYSKPVAHWPILIGYGKLGAKSITVVHAQNTKPLVPVQEKNTLKSDKNPSELSYITWSGRANLGANLQTGNSEKNALNIDAIVKAKWLDKHRVIIEAEYNREKDSGNITENNRALEGVYDYFFNTQWFMNSTLSFEQDDINKIDLQTTAGFGLGYQAFERDDLNLKFILGPSYLRTDFENGNSENSAAVRWDTNYDQKFFQRMMQVFHGHELVVPADDTDGFLLDTKTGLRVPIKNGLLATAQIDFDWDNKPEPGITEEDIQYSLKLGYEW